MMEEDPEKPDSVKDGDEGKAISFLQSYLSAVKDQFAERNRNFAQLDQKAQATAGMAGIFLAVLFASMKSDTLAQLKLTLGVFGRIGLAVSGIGLVTAVLLCLLGLRIRNVIDVDESSSLLQLFADMEAITPDERSFPGVHSSFLAELSRHYLFGVSVLTVANDRKAKVIFGAQIILAGSICVISAALIMFAVRYS